MSRSAEGDDRIREQIRGMLAHGLETRHEALPDDHRQFMAILDELRALEPGDLEGKLKIGGWLDHPYGSDEMCCRDCMYYLVRRRRCDLPELALPTEPDWFCRLWRR